MATFSLDVVATSFSCSTRAIPVTSSLTAFYPTTYGALATFSDRLLTTSTCISLTTSSYNLMAALPHTLVAATHSDLVPAIGAVVDVLQRSSLPVSSCNLMPGSLCKATSRVCLARINSSLLCFLCGGYLIDATTINRCVHSFCRACILRHLKLANFCPVCKSHLGSTRPHKSLRPDRTLQRVVYKVVPGLYKNERERRRKFAAVNRKPEVFHRSHHQKVRPQSDHLAGNWVYSDDENFSVCLRHQLHLNNASARLAQFPVKDGDGFYGNTNQVIDCRFVLCPAVTAIQLIKKFIKLKLNLRGHSKIFLFCSGEILPDDYTLLDVAYIFSWMKTGPLLIDYVILNTVQSGGDACHLSAAAVAAVTEDAQLLPQQNLGNAQTNSSGPETKGYAYRVSPNQSCVGVVLDPVDQNVCAHLEMSYQTKNLNDAQNSQDLPLTGSNISFSNVVNNVPHGFLPSFSNGASQVALLHSSFDASRPVDLGTKDAKVFQKNSTITCIENPQKLDYFCEAMMTGTGEGLQPEFSTNQFAQAACHQISCGSDSGHSLAFLPESALAVSVPHLLDSSSCGVGGVYSYGEDISTSACGIQLIGLFTQSVDGSIIQLPDSCLLYNRPVINNWHPSMHETEMDCWRSTGTNNCFGDRENTSERVRFVLPMMQPRANADADEVAEAAGVGLPVFQYCNGNADCLRSSFEEPFMPYYGHSCQALPTADARTEATQGKRPDDLDQACRPSWLGTSQIHQVARGAQRNTGDHMAVDCTGKLDEMNREIDDRIAVVPEQRVVLSEGLPQPLLFLHANGQKESSQMYKMYDSSSGNVSEDKMVIDRSVAAPAAGQMANVLDDGCCSMSVPSEYATVSVESHRVSPTDYHLAQTVADLTPVPTYAVLSLAQHSKMPEDASRLTFSSSHFLTTSRCSSPAFKCQMSAASSDQSMLPPPLPYCEQSSLDCNTETAAGCCSYEAGSEAGWQTPPSAMQTGSEEMSQSSAATGHWDDKRRQDELLTVTVSVSAELTKPALVDAAEGESGQLDKELPPVDVELLAVPRLSLDSANVTDRSLELTTQS